MGSFAKKYFGMQPGKDILRDYQHAARLFTDGDQRLAPKTKYLYHVVFGMGGGGSPTELSMLARSVDLPRFNIQTDTLNQYNRKRITQVKIDYQPVQIKFYDDNSGVTRQLWEQYYSYYYGDYISANNAAAYAKNAYSLGSVRPVGKFGLDNGSLDNFFREIVIYQMSKKQWNSYKLVNPKIQSWTHDNLDYGSSQPAEHTMTLIYEAVGYDTGFVSQGNPPGFGIEHYDTTPSPYGLTGSNVGRIAGALQGAASVFGAISTGEAFSSPLNALATAITAVNSYQNIKNVKNATTSDKIIGGLAGASVLSETVGAGTNSGVRNVAFPVASTISSVNATARAVNNLKTAVRGR
jgi:hypothetical protein